MKRIMFFLLMLPTCILMAQTNGAMLAKTGTGMPDGQLARGVEIGGRLPDISFDHMMNYPKTHAHLSNFKAKLTILDFWNTACSNCIALFPHMQSLEEEFKGQIRIVLIDGQSKLYHDDSAKILRSVSRLDEMYGIKVGLPIVYNCPALDSFVQYVSVPQEVWLDENGKIIAETGATEVNKENIQAILDGRPVAMHMKLDHPMDFRNKPLSECLWKEGLYLPPTVSSSFYKGWIDGLGAYGNLRDTANPSMVVGFQILNYPLFFICKFAYMDEANLADNQFAFEVRDATAFVDPVNSGTSDYWYENSWSYESTSYPTTQQRLIKNLQGDLERMLGISLMVKDSVLNCVLVTASPRLQHSFSKGGRPTFTAGGIEPQNIVRNISIKDVLQELNNWCPLPLIDSTGMTRPIDMDLPRDMKDKKALFSALRTAGFDLQEVQRMMKVAVIKQE
jgi:thiol-disulfide isomerase/thioredoxin